MPSFKEKRKFRRVDVSVPLRYKELHGKSYLAKGTLTKNLSEGGVRFRTDRFVGLACHLMLEMNMPSIVKSIKAISKIAWIKKLPAGENYEVGSQFLAMTNEDEAVVSHYIKGH